MESNLLLLQLLPGEQEQLPSTTVTGNKTVLYPTKTSSSTFLIFIIH